MYRVLCLVLYWSPVQVLPIGVLDGPSAIERFDVEMTLHEHETLPDARMLRLKEKQRPEKLLQRSDVHQLAEVLENCLHGIWSKGTDSGQFAKAREAIEICMNELSKQVAVHCADRGLLLNHTFKKYAGLHGLQIDKIVEMEGEADDMEENRRKMEETMQFMRDDMKLMMSEVHLYNEALHAMVSDVIALQNEVSKVEGQRDKKSMELNNLRMSHVELIQKLGTTKLKCILKEKMRRRARMQLQQVEARFDSIELRAVTAEAKVQDQAHVIKDMSADATFKDKMYQEHVDELSDELDNANREVTLPGASLSLTIVLAVFAAVATPR